VFDAGALRCECEPRAEVPRDGLEDFEPPEEKADAVKGGFKEATGFDSESETTE